jgi:hypothetical protein
VGIVVGTSAPLEEDTIVSLGPFPIGTWH